MTLSVPSSLSPSKLASFTSCGLQFRFSAIDHIPQSPTVATSRGTLVHRALEVLYRLPAEQRVPGVIDACVAAAHESYRHDAEWTGLDLDEGAEAVVIDAARRLAGNIFQLENPTEVTTVGLELDLAIDLDGLLLRGIIDRVDLVDGDLVVTDYKTGRAPTDTNARSRLAGVHVYSLLCERHFGRRPVRVQLLHLAEPVAVITEPTDQSTRGIERRLRAVWTAVEHACATDYFRPQPSGLCNHCSYRQWCPSFGGDPTRAVIDTEVAARAAAGQQALLEI